MRSGRIISFLLTCVVTTVAVGESPTTRPARQTWADTVQNFAVALLTDAKSCQQFVHDEISIRQFNSSTLRLTTEQFQLRMAKATVIGAHAYSASPKSFATDLAQDFAADGIPDALRSQMTPSNDAAIARANAVAEKWIESLVNPSADESVALIILLQRAVGKDAASSPDVPIFVIAKGSKSRDGFKLSQIVFGDPRFTSAEAKAQ